MKGWVIGIAVTAIAFAILASLLPQIRVGGVPELVVLAIVFGVVNSFIKPVVKLLSFPVSAMTLGLFGIVINGALLLFTAWAADTWFDARFTIAGFPPDLSIEALVWAIVASVVLAILTTVIGLVVPD